MRSLASDSRDSTKDIVQDWLRETKREEDGPTFTIPAPIIEDLISDSGKNLAEIQAALNDATIELVELSARVDEQLAQELENTINGVVNNLNVIVNDIDKLAESVGSPVRMSTLFV